MALSWVWGRVHGKKDPAEGGAFEKDIIRRELQGQTQQV